MKIRCECGEIIADQTDYLPYKAHLISDQDWFGVFDAIDKVMEDLSAARISIGDAQMAARRIHVTASRSIWQCYRCGRLLMPNGQNKVSIYTPTSDEDSKEILKSVGPRK